MFCSRNKVSKQNLVLLPTPHKIVQSEATIYSLAFSPDSKSLAVGSGNEHKNVVEFWNVHKGQRRFTATISERFYAGALAFSPDGTVLAAGYHGYSWPIIAWHTATGKSQKRYRGHQGNVDYIKYSQDGKTLLSVSAYEEKKIRAWNVSEGRQLYAARLEGVSRERDEFIRSAVFSPDRKMLAGGVSRYADGAKEVSELRLWDARTGKLIYRFTEQSEGIFDLAFSSDGATLAGASGDKTVKIWNIKTKTLSFVLQGHHSSVVSVGFSRDGKLLVSGSGDSLNDEPGEVILWDVRKRDLIKVLTQDDEPAYLVAISPDQKLIASSHEDKIKIWALVKVVGK